MHFTSIIFSNDSVVEIPGVVSGLPGATKQDVRDGEGTIEQDKDKNRNAGKTAEIALPTGATVGSIAGLGAGHPIAGSFEGLGAGLAAVGIVSLFTRGADVSIEAGSQVEMVLQRPLILEEENLASHGSHSRSTKTNAKARSSPTDVSAREPGLQLDFVSFNNSR
jgi:hypothetical protein